MARLPLGCPTIVVCALFVTLATFVQAFAHFSPNAEDFALQSSLPTHFEGSFFLFLMHYIWQGMLHIFIGLDHVLFVTCLALAIGWSGRILWSVTGFTLGHSVTLVLGGFGFSPHDSWFAPMIEAIIALSILYAAIIALQNVWKGKKEFTGTSWYLSGIAGLVHGYGFSFVFAELVSGSTQQVATALAGFNIGIEIGQFVIIAIILAVSAGSGWFWKQAPKWISSGMAAGTIAVACIWVTERGLVLYGALSPTLS